MLLLVDIAFGNLLTSWLYRIFYFFESYNMRTLTCLPSMSRQMDKVSSGFSLFRQQLLKKEFILS